MKSILLTILVLYIGIGTFLFFWQRSFIYMPVAPFQSNLPEKIIVNEGHRIKISILNEGKRNAIIYFGGNAENVEHNADEFSQLLEKHTVYLLKYRGYSGSTGQPSEDAIYSDAAKTYDIVKTKHDEISIIGRSLGSAVATYVASEKEVKKLVLVTPFDSIQNVAQSRFPLYPMRLLLWDKHDSYSRADKIKSETLVIAAMQDKIIHISHTERLIEGFTSDVLFKVIEDTGHNNISEHPEYREALGDFL